MEEPAPMIMFRGRTGFNPNTINNFNCTYILAYWWQHQHSLELMKGIKNPKFTYENWLKLIYDLTAFNNDWKKFKGMDLTLFADWAIYGDGLLLYELEAVATFDPDKDDSIKILKEGEKFLLTDKFGEHWGTMVDQDTDAQVFSTIYAMKMNIDGQI